MIEACPGKVKQLNVPAPTFEVVELETPAVPPITIDIKFVSAELQEVEPKPKRLTPAEIAMIVAAWPVIFGVPPGPGKYWYVGAPALEAVGRSPAEL